MFVPNTAQGILKLKIYSLFTWNWYLNRCLHFYLLNLAPLHGFLFSENKSNVFIHGLRAPVWGALFHTFFPSLCLLFPDSSDPSALESLFWLFFLPRSYPNHLIEYCKPSSPQHPWFPPHPPYFALCVSPQHSSPSSIYIYYPTNLGIYWVRFLFAFPPSKERSMNAGACVNHCAPAA